MTDRLEDTSFTLDGVRATLRDNAEAMMRASGKAITPEFHARMMAVADESAKAQFDCIQNFRATEIA